MTKVVYSVVAEFELDRLIEYVEQESGSARAGLVVTRISDSLRTLATFPNLGRASSSDGERRFAINPWVIVYRPLADGEGIFILRIVDGRRDLPDIL
jgi:plasmid stabilization system protein ParE